MSLPSVPVTRRSRSIDTSQFSEVMALALAAYRQDPSYAVAMAKQASTIQNKRDVWALRTELRKAEAAARAQCAVAPEDFVCTTKAPCGTGPCPFAEGDLAQIEVPEAAGRTPRPRGSDSYTIEAAIKPLMVIRQP